MQTLKEARKNIGATQMEVASLLHIAAPTYNLYDTGQDNPPLEDMIIIERSFSQPILWPDNIPDEDKRIIINSIVRLSSRFPLQTIITFTQKYLREGLRIDAPSKLIEFFTDKALSNDIEPLPNIGF